MNANFRAIECKSLMTFPTPGKACRLQYPKLELNPPVAYNHQRKVPTCKYYTTNLKNFAIWVMVTINLPPSSKSVQEKVRYMVLLWYMSLNTPGCRQKLWKFGGTRSSNVRSLMYSDFTYLEACPWLSKLGGDIITYVPPYSGPSEGLNIRVCQ